MTESGDPFSISPDGLNTVSDHPKFRDSPLPGLFSNHPFCFVDIGARGGMHELVLPIARDTVAIAFEPDSDECARLRERYAQDPRWGRMEFEPIGLYGENGQFPLYLQKVDTNHSLLEPNPSLTNRYRMEKFAQVGKTLIETRRFDDVFSDRRARGHLSSPDLVKIDTQGSEFEILTGAKAALANDIVGVVTEISFCEVYKGQKLFSDIEVYLRAAGFSFFGFKNLHTRSRRFLDKSSHILRERLIFGDAIFLKDPLPGGNTRSPLSERKLAALLLCALLTGYYDFALELIEEPTFFPGDCSSALNELVRSLALAPSGKGVAAVEALSKRVSANPDRSNVEIGRFLDERREYCDYHDVFNVSSLPKDYS
jgi:FkbM family methyltransferase